MFFGWLRRKVSKRFRVLLSMARIFLVNRFDNWRWYLTLIGIVVFFVWLLPLPYLYLSSKYQIYGSLWLVLCLIVAIFLINREMNRRDKTKMGVKWHDNPNAVDEYIELLKKRKH
jgi:hypothetical protein